MKLATVAAFSCSLMWASSTQAHRPVLTATTSTAAAKRYDAEATKEQRAAMVKAIGMCPVGMRKQLLTMMPTDTDEYGRYSMKLIYGPEVARACSKGMGRRRALCTQETDGWSKKVHGTANPKSRMDQKANAAYFSMCMDD